MQKWTGHAKLETIATFYHSADADVLAEKLWQTEASVISSGVNSDSKPGAV
jgi:hypothetical protein